MTNKKTTSYKFARHLSLPILLSLGLVACNSGSSSNGSTMDTDASVLTGKITGVALEGLSYQTETQSGKTSADSTFTYKQGELVSFFIGDISLGQAEASEEITLFDMMGINKPGSVTQSIETKLKSTAQQPTRSPKTFQFERLSNVIVFLSAIDEDGTFSNGVTVPAQLETVAQGKTIDIIGKQIVAFESQLDESNLLSEGVTEGIWPSKPVLVLPGVALDAFYDSIGVTPEIYTESKRLFDTDNDGTFDGNQDIVYNYTFDDAGNLSTLHKQLVNGTEAELTRYTYDDNGNTTGTYIDIGDDGSTDYQYEWAYNAKGREILKQTDFNGDGFFENRTTREITYHTDGSLAYEKELNESYSDSTNALESSQTTIQQYDSEGQFIYYEQSYEIPANGVSEGQSERNTYDSAGNVIRIERDEDLDGVIDNIQRYEFDENNEQILKESDFNADGTPDSVTTTVIDPDTKQAIVSIDNFADGVPEQADGIIDSVGVIDYDSHDNRIRSRYDENNDGIYEEETTWDITYDAEGRILSRNQVSSSSPETNSLITYTYDSEGRMLTHQQVGDSDQVRNYLYTTTYDEQGRETGYSAVDDNGSYVVVIHDEFGSQTATQYDAEGVVIAQDKVLYDERGNYIGTSSAEDDSGVPQHEITMTYNSDDLLTSKRQVSGGEEVYRYEYSYDEQGELFSTVNYQYDPSTPNFTATYEYTNIKSWKALFQRFYREWSNQS